MAQAATLDPNTDPMTGLKRRIVQSLDPSTPAEPTTTNTAETTLGSTTAAPFAAPQNYAQAGVQDQPPAPAPASSVTSPAAPAPTVQAPTVARTTLDTAPAPAPAGGVNYDAVNALYQKYLGRQASQQEAANWANGTYGATDLAGIESQIASSGEATDYAKNHGGATAGGGDLMSRIRAALAAAGSSDDPNYWYAKISADPNGAGSAWGYWQDRINRGDTAQLGLPRFNDGGSTSSGGVAPPTPYTPQNTNPTAPPVNTAFQDAIRQQIMDRLKTAGTPVDQNAAGITDAVSAARDENTRAGEQERTALAERLYAQGAGGLQSNALTQQIQQSGERTAQNTSGLRANLIMQEYTRKQQELDQLLSMATASGDAESARNIQLYQAQLQAELQREGISADLAKYSAYLDQNAALSGLHG